MNEHSLKKMVYRVVLIFNSRGYEQDLDKSSGSGIGCPIALVALLGYPGRWRHQWDGNAEHRNSWMRKNDGQMNKWTLPMLWYKLPYSSCE